MPDLTEFLLARIAEDEESARACGGSAWRYQLWNGEDRVIDVDDQEVVAVFDLDMDAMHAARWTPARVLAECETKRRIVEAIVELFESGRHENTYTGFSYILEQLALPFADHADYRGEWRPE